MRGCDAWSPQLKKNLDPAGQSSAYLSARITGQGFTVVTRKFSLINDCHVGRRGRNQLDHPA
jgi:hypothetical protein